MKSKPPAKRDAVMKVTALDISKLKPCARNPRIITDEAVAEVAKSIEQFKFQQPIVIRPDNEIVAGHTRWRAALKLGLKKTRL